MKRLRPRCFEKILAKEESRNFRRVSWVRVERLRRLVWCYNKYLRLDPSTMPYLLFTLAEYYGKVKRNCPPGVWLPEIRTE